VRPYPGLISPPADATPVDRRGSERRDAIDDAPPVSIRRYVGIDLATEAKRTGVAIIEIDGTKAVAALPGDGFVADDRGLVEVIDRSTVVGLDSPLGWPDDFVSAVTAHRQSARWPTFEHRSTDKIRESLRHRTTDLFVRSLDLGSTPLSVSSDLIGVVAMRGAWLQSAWAQKWGRLEPRDGSGRLIETYPAAALRAWGLLARRGVRYKGGGVGELRDSQRAERARILREIEEQTSSWLRVPEALRVEAEVSDHTLDAFVCALVALATRANVTHPTPEESREAALREGWIHVPSDALSSLGDRLPQS
jgi:predicted nuclease with RNAse H fold